MSPTMIFRVKQTGPGKARGLISNFDRGFSAPCALGKNGIVTAHNAFEGDGATPIGTWPIRQVWYRPDRGPRPVTSLPVRIITPTDGWCDASDDPAYNQHVTLPYPRSAERLYRRDTLYDIVVELGFNDAPVIPNKGSAIFMHQARPGMTPTLGCVALRPNDLRALLRLARPGSAIQVMG